MAGETVLVIDTDSETEQKIVSTLEAEGYLVFTSPAGDLGVAMAERLKPSLIFVDPDAVGSKGLEICRTIHNVESLKDVPVIILTSYEGAMEPRYTSVYGIVDFIKIPFSPEELVVKTDNVLTMEFLDAQPVTEEDIEPDKPVHDLSGDEDRTTIEKEMPDIEKDYSEEIDVSDTPVINQIMGEIEGEEKIEKIAEEEQETEEEKIEGIAEEEQETEEEKEEMERQRPYVLKRGIQRRGNIRKRNRLFVPVIVLIIIIISISTVGVLLYRGLRHGTGVQTPVEVKPAHPVQLNEVEVVSPLEQQNQEQLIEEPESVSVPVLVPESKPAGKTSYSVQLGAFKNQRNAEILARKYREKGYKAFTHKGTGKDNTILYRVLIGRFENRKESSILAGRIHAEEEIEITIFSQ